MKIPCLAVAVPAFAMAFAIAACSNDTSAVIPVGAGSVAGGGNYGGSTGVASGSSSGGGATEAPPEDAGSLSNTPGPGTGGDDANAPRPEGGPVTEPDAGSSSGGFGVDGQVPVIDSGVPSTNGPLGSCGNPACGTEGTDCGCQATDSQGNTIQLGCEAGGQCACFVNGYQATNAFDENGACGSQQATAQQFLQYCVSTCN